MFACYCPIEKKYVGIDMGSGYPYFPANWSGIRFWEDSEDAIRYAKMFNFDVVKVRLYQTEVIFRQ